MARASIPRITNVRAKPNLLGELAGIEAGRDITRPYVGPLLVPQDPILANRGFGNPAFYKPILTDDQVKSCMTQRISAVTARDWEVRPGEDSRAGRKAADWLREQLARLDWDLITEQMLWGKFYGLSVAEMIYAADGGTWGIDAIKVRDRVRFRFDADGGLRLLTQSDMLTGEAMPPEKFWVFATGADHGDEPYGLGLAHWLYWPVFFKKNDLRLWLAALDKFASPTALGTAPRGATQDEMKRLLEAVQAIQSEAGIVIPEGMEISLLSPQGGTGGNLSYRDLHEVMNAAIAKVILTQTMTTDNGSSEAQARVHEDKGDDVAKADADGLCGSFNRGPVAWLTRRNFGDVAPPQVWRIMEQPEDIDAAVQRDKTLHDMGWRMTEERVRDVYGDGYERAAPAPVDPTAPAFAEAVHQGAIDRLVAEMVTDDYVELTANATTGDIAAVLQGATTLDELKRRLDALADVPVDLAALTEKLAEATYAARLAGELGAPLEEAEL